jgi:hypothetical protein
MKQPVVGYLLRYEYCVCEFHIVESSERREVQLDSDGRTFQRACSRMGPRLGCG